MNSIMSGPVRVRCRQCNKEYPSSEMSLDSVSQMVVCAACVKANKSKQAAIGSKIRITNTPLRSMESTPAEKKQPVRNTPAFNPQGPSLAVLSSKQAIGKGKNPNHIPELDDPDEPPLTSIQMRAKLTNTPGPKTTTVARPKGWDRDDEILERATKEKQSKPELDDDRKRYACPKCGYKFAFGGSQKRMYARCPFCGADLTRNMPLG
jgi:DNA-directed RNA polymerase subunit RPC12/RpoP